LGTASADDDHRNAIAVGQRRIGVLRRGGNQQQRKIFNYESLDTR
jgi:hypothetical protein